MPSKITETDKKDVYLFEFECGEEGCNEHFQYQIDTKEQLAACKIKAGMHILTHSEQKA